MSNERIDIESMEARMRLWAIGDVSDEDLALELDYVVPELKRCYEEIDRVRAIAEDLHAYIVSNADISLSVAEKQMDWVDASE